MAPITRPPEFLRHPLPFFSVFPFFSVATQRMNVEVQHCIYLWSARRSPGVQAQKFFSTRHELEQMFGSAALFRQLVDAQWVKIVRPGKRGRATLYCYLSAQRAADRIRSPYTTASSSDSPHRLGRGSDQQRSCSYQAGHFEAAARNYDNDDQTSLHGDGHSTWSPAAPQNGTSDGYRLGFTRRRPR